jgi:hypothetical protein
VLISQLCFLVVETTNLNGSSWIHFKGA